MFPCSKSKIVEIELPEKVAESIEIVIEKYFGNITFKKL